MPPMFDQAREKELARRVFAALYPEDYWAKLSRIAGDPHSRILASHHPCRHFTTYTFAIQHAEGPKLLDISCETLSQMEVISPSDPPCPVCKPRGKIRGFLYLRKKGE
jgi:hypothetical protein